MMTSTIEGTEMLRSTEEEMLLAHKAKDMENHVRQCNRCLHFKHRLQIGQFTLIETTHPIELMHINYLTIESGK